MTDRRANASQMSPAATLPKVMGVATVGAPATPTLDEILSRAAFTAIVLAPAGGPDQVAAAVKVVQAHGMAALVLDDWALASRVAADGVHLSPRSDAVAAYRQARSVLGPAASIGVDAGRSRHDAMELGEAGADYIAFSVDTTAGDADQASADRDDLIAWWAEVFEVPCVAYLVRDADDGQRLADLGADFIAYRIDEHEQ